MNQDQLQRKRDRKTGGAGDDALYCRKNHRHPDGLCSSCAALDAYARQRSDRCPFMENKTFCSNCRVHCYNREMREQIRR